jgi:hypothetical protein
MRLSLPREALRGFLCAVVGLNLVACNATKSSPVSSPSSSDAPASNASSSAGSQSDTGSQSTSSSSSGASSNNNSVASVAPAPQSLPPLTVSGIRLSSVDSGIEASGVTYSGMSD